MEDNKIILTINKDEHPLLFDQLNKINDNILLKGNIKNDEKITSILDYLEDLIKLDNIINGPHFINVNGDIIRNKDSGCYNLYGARRLKDYKNIRDDDLIDDIYFYVDELNTLIHNIYKDIPSNLINSYISNRENNKIINLDFKEYNNAKDIFIIPKGDNLSVLCYYIYLLTNVKNELEIRHKRNIPNKLPEMKADNEFIKLADQLISYFNGNEMPGDVLEIIMYAQLSIKVLKKDWLGQELDINTWFEILHTKTIVEGVEPYRNIINLIALNISKMFIINYLKNLDCLDSINFNYYLKYFIEHYNKKDKKKILKKCKNITPYAKKMYKELYCK